MEKNSKRRIIRVDTRKLAPNESFSAVFDAEAHAEAESILRGMHEFAPPAPALPGSTVISARRSTGKQGASERIEHFTFFWYTSAGNNITPEKVRRYVTEYTYAVAT